MAYIIDTNVILDRDLENVIQEIPLHSKLVIPLTVLEELDRFKKGSNVINANCRNSIRLLDQLRNTGSITDGVYYKDRVVQVYVDDDDIDLKKADNRIIALARDLNMLEDTSILTQDIHERIIADVFGIQAAGLSYDDVDTERLYNCITKVKFDDDQINEFIINKHIETRKHLLANQFVEISDSTKTKHYGIYKSADKNIYKLNEHYKVFNIKPKDIEQSMFIHLLLDPSVKFVSCLGGSGTGKTLLALAAGLEQVLNSDRYSKIVVLRPLVSVGNDIGFLPGSKTEKLEQWMGSTFDNLEYLLCNYTIKDKGMYVSGKEKVYDLMNQGIIELEAMSFIRGRSIPNQYILVDDCQNLNIQQAATLITRVGEGSKLIFLGDINRQQIDNHMLTPTDNGLTYAITKLRGQSDIVGHIALTEIVRSELAKLGVKYL
jgi:PhoH-like ATPase